MATPQIDRTTTARPSATPRLKRLVALASGRVATLLEDPAVRGLGEWTVVDGVALLEQQLAAGAVDAVLCQWSDALTKTLDRAVRPFRLIACGEVTPTMLAAIGQGHPIQHVGSVEELLAQVHALRPRRARERWANAIDLGVEIDGQRHDLIELSNDGLSFEVDAAVELDRLLPGRVIDELVLRRDDERVLDGITAIVRHVATTDRDTVRIGCSFEAPRPQRAAVRSRTLRGRAIAAGLLQSALETSGVVLRGNGLAMSQHASGGVDAGALDFIVDVIEHTAETFDVVRGAFEIGGSVYRFTSTVVGTAPLRVRIPGELEEHNERLARRHKPAADQPISVELCSPLTARPIVGEVYDVSSRGVSVDLDADRDLLPIGLQLVEVALGVAGERVSCRGTVRNRVLLGDGRVRCGIELQLTAAERAHLAGLLTRDQFAKMHEGANVSFDQLLGFFRETGYLSPAREEALEPTLPEVRRTFDALSNRPNRLLKTVVCRDGDRLLGHISSVRAYRDTFMIQHLAAVNGRETGLALSLANAEYLIQNADFDYIKIWFHAHNRFPARVFGGFARKVQDPQLCNLKAYAHVTVPTDRPLSAEPSTLDVIEASGEDLVLVERHFIATEAPLLLRSDDLTRGALNLDRVQASYRRFGLQRRRRVLLAMDRDVPLGFALVEVSSPGLNLFEALSRFSIHMLPAGHAQDAAVRSALLGAVQAIYRQNGRAYASALLSPDEADAYRRIGVALDAEQSMCVTTTRSELRRFFEHMERLGVRRRRRPDAAAARAQILGAETEPA